MSVNIDYLCFVQTDWKMRSQNMNNGWFTCASKIVEISKRKIGGNLVKNQTLIFFSRPANIALFSNSIWCKDSDDISVNPSNKQQKCVKNFVFNIPLFISQGTSKDLCSKTVLENFFNFTWMKEHDTDLQTFKIEKNR